MTAAGLLQPNDRLGHYVIVEQRARGGMGVVYHARDSKLQRDVALKVLASHLTAEPGFTARFQREAVSMARLSHPNIVQVYDADQQDGMYFLAMEYVPGDSLFRALSRLRQAGQVMPEAAALGIARQVASALDYAHRKGLVHRDVKPSNVLQAGDDRWVLTDFGIVMDQGAERITKNISSIGTPEYMSPEQGQGLMVDGRSDVYSLGIMLYEMLSGKPPFTSDSALSTIFMHVQEPLPSLANVRKGLSKVTIRIVEKACAKQPGQRFQSASDMVRAIDVALGNAPDSGSIWAAGAAKPAAAAPPPAAQPQAWQPGKAQAPAAQPMPMRPARQPAGLPTRPAGGPKKGSPVPIIVGTVAVLGLLAIGGFLVFGGARPPTAGVPTPGAAAPPSAAAPTNQAPTALPARTAPTVGGPAASPVPNIAATATAQAAEMKATTDAGQAVVEPTASAAPTAEREPTATSTGAPVVLGALKVDVLNGRGGYEEWGKPRPEKPCEGDDKNGRTFRFALSFNVTNPSGSDVDKPYVVFLAQAGGPALTACATSGGLPGTIKAGQTVGPFSYVTFIDTRTVREMQIAAAGGRVLPARACFSDISVSPC